MGSFIEILGKLSGSFIANDSVGYLKDSGSGSEVIMSRFVVLVKPDGSGKQDSRCYGG